MTDEITRFPLGPHPRDAHGRFTPGNPGKPIGARNRISGRVARFILKDFEASQEDMLEKLKRWYVPQYVSLLSKLLPKAGEEGGLEALDAAAQARVVAEARAALDRIEAGEGTLSDLESALLGGP